MNASLPAFFAASLLLAVTPGPGVVYIVTRTLGQGRAAGLASVAGVACGNGLNALGAALGLAALFLVWSGAFLVVKYAGAAYLVWLGWRMWRSAGTAQATGAGPTAPVPLGRLWRDGLVVALLNPKTTLFFAAFLPQFMDEHQALLPQAVALGGLFVLIAAATDAGYALLASVLAPTLARRRGAGRLGRRASGASLIALGVLGAATGSAPGRPAGVTRGRGTGCDTLGARSPPRHAVEPLLSGYAALEGRYDELLSDSGEPRPHWRDFLRSLAARDGAEIGDTLSLMEREIRENGITYNVYADPKGADRPWEVDPLPLLIAPDEWAQIETGIAQRADLLNRVLADLYGPQTLLRSGAIAPAVVFGHGGFLHPVQGVRPPGGVHLFQYAADLARSPDGHWWVVSDRTQAPSGAGYALENRLVISRVFPQMFANLNVQHLASFFAALRDSLLRWAPRGDGPPLVVLLTPGPYNETYFEHALLARYLGFPLVEGSDLTVRAGCVWMKTVEGLKRVHALLRRQDDDYCDPLELRSDSALGVAGLTDCARRGTVFIANALGSGVLESGALLGYLPKLSQRLLGEPLKLPSVATWWLGEPAAFDDAWKRLDSLLIKPLERSVREPAVFGADLSEAQRAALRAKVANRPQRYVAQEWVHVSQAPVLERVAAAGAAGRRRHDAVPPGARDVLAARTVGVRVFAVATPGGYRVMPGGLTRIAGDGDSRVIAMQRGGRSKDTWVLSSAPVNASFSLISTTVRPEDLNGSRANLPSRAAENLFWFGRYGERAEGALRTLRVAIGSLLDHVDAGAGGAAPAVLLAERLGLVDGLEEPGIALLRAATHPDEAVAQSLKQLSRSAFNLRDRMSDDNWRTLNQLTGDPIFRRGAGLPLALAWLDRAVASMVTLSGFVLDGMTRSVGWRFLSIGRRVERLSALSQALQVATVEGSGHGLDWLLELCDSTVTYRSRYLVAPEWLPVLDMLLRDETNPRSVAFQLKGLVEYIAKLEMTHGRFASELLAPAQAALRALEPEDLQPDGEAVAALLEMCRHAAASLSDELTLKFFSHAASRSVLSLVA